MLIDLAALFVLLQAAVAGFSVLAGIMAAYSGFFAARGFLAGCLAEDLTGAINEGVAIGFLLGAPFAVVAFMIVLGGS